MNTTWYEIAVFFAGTLIKMVPQFLFVTFLAGLTLQYIPIESLKERLDGQEGLGGMIAASVLGFITPFCSCGSLPVIAGMVAADIPLDILTAFMFASPFPIEVALVFLGPTMGWGYAATFAAAGSLIAIFSGQLIRRLRWSDQLREEAQLFGMLSIYNDESNETESGSGEGAETSALDGFLKKIWASVKYAFHFLKELFPNVLFGAAIGAFIHGFLPKGLIESFLGGNSLIAVPLAAILGVPLYVSILPVIPIMITLNMSGVSTGAIIAFLVTATSISPPEVVMLRGMFKDKYLVLFIGMVTLGGILTGYLFNIII